VRLHLARICPVFFSLSPVLPRVADERPPAAVHRPERHSMSAFSPRRCAAVVAPVLALGSVLLGAAPASAASPAVLLTEVYGGGGNAGATWRNDFVELFNKS